eukprot:9009445-Lingulodinium_polyedra.AAC.1
MGEQLVARFHTDNGSEFLNNAMKDTLIKRNIFQTRTMGYDPRANGKGERCRHHQAEGHVLPHTLRLSTEVLVVGGEAGSTRLP